MSKARVIYLVVKKETTDLLRDRRTIITALAIPLLIFPLLFGVIGYFANPTSNPSPVLLVNHDGGSLSTNLTNILLQTPGITLTKTSTANLTDVIESGKYDVAIEVPTNFTNAIQAGGQMNLTLYYDPANGRAQQGIAIIQGITSSFSQEVVAQRLASKGITKTQLNPVGLQPKAVSKATNQSLLTISTIFPSFLLYFTFLGAFYFIVDDIFGEKERRSLEALFTLPPKRSTIFLGKLSVAFLLSMITAGLGLGATLISLSSLSRGSQVVASLPSYLLPPIIAIVALAGLSMCALGFCISTFAKNIREAQQYLSPVFFVLFLPIYFVSFLPPNQLAQYSYIPILGFSILMRDIIIGTATPLEYAGSIAANLLTLLLLVWLAIRLLNSEKIILRS